ALVERTHPELEGAELSDAVLDVIERMAEQVQLPLPLRLALALQAVPRHRAAETLVKIEPVLRALLVRVLGVAVDEVLERVNRRDPCQHRDAALELLAHRPGVVRLVTVKAVGTAPVR